jgi:hypothetical protein
VGVSKLSCMGRKMCWTLTHLFTKILFLFYDIFPSWGIVFIKYVKNLKRILQPLKIVLNRTRSRDWKGIGVLDWQIVVVLEYYSVIPKDSSTVLFVVMLFLRGTRCTRLYKGAGYLCIVFSHGCRSVWTSDSKLTRNTGLACAWREGSENITICWWQHLYCH